MRRDRGGASPYRYFPCPHPGAAPPYRYGAFLHRFTHFLDRYGAADPEHALPMDRSMTSPYRSIVALYRYGEARPRDREALNRSGTAVPRYGEAPDRGSIASPRDGGAMLPAVFRFFHPALWGAVLALALGLRLPALTAGLPYLGYIDEGHVLHLAVRLVGERTWDPGRYRYPSLPIYAIAAAVAAEAPFYAAVHGHPLGRDLSPYPPRYYDLVEPVDVIVAGRLLTLAVSLATVILTGLLARRLAGEAAGLFAALLAALLPALVIRGTNVTVDPWAAGFTVAALWLAEGAVRKEDPRRRALLVGAAGAMAGCALTSKYPAVLVAVAVAATLLRVPGDWRHRAGMVGIAAAGGLLAAAATMPALVLESGAVRASLARTAEAYGNARAGDYWQQAVRQSEWDQPLDGPELGLAFLACAALGGLLALRDRRLAGTVLAWALYAAALGLLLSRYPARPFRNLLPLLPLACVLAALPYARLRERLQRPRWLDVAAVLCALAFLLPGDLAYALDRADLVDSRVRAIDWAAAHLAPGEAVLVSEELAIVRGDLARLPGEALVLEVPAARDRLRRRRDIAMVITSDLNGATGLPDLQEGGRMRTAFRLAARFGDPHEGAWENRRQLVGQWRSNDEPILIYQRIPPRGDQGRRGPASR